MDYILGKTGSEIDAYLDCFIAPNTVYNIEADGSGDFRDIFEAIEFLTGKFSSGQVVLKLGEGTFTLDKRLTINTDDFNFSRLCIEGTNDNTTIMTYYDGAYSYGVRINWSSTSVTVSNIKFVNNQKSGVNAYGIGSVCADVTLSNISIDGYSGDGIVVVGGTAFITNKLVINGTSSSVSYGVNGFDAAIVSYDFRTPVYITNCKYHHNARYGSLIAGRIENHMSGSSAGNVNLTNM